MNHYKSSPLGRLRSKGLTSDAVKASSSRSKSCSSPATTAAQQPSCCTWLLVISILAIKEVKAVLKATATAVVAGCTRSGKDLATLTAAAAKEPAHIPRQLVS